MMDWLQPHIVAMTGYTPGEQPRPEQRVVKLNTNENPYPPSPTVMAALRELSADALRRYPDPMAGRLRAAAAELWGGFGVTPAHVLAGNGSDDLLTILARATLSADDTAVMPWPTYSLYDTLTELQNSVSVHVPWPSDWSLPVEELSTAGGQLVLVANPNAPSGTAVPVRELQRLAERLAQPRSDGRAALLVVDEAYADFSDDSFLRVVTAHANVVVLRTLSKSYSLAGARIGLAVGEPSLIAELVKVKDSYNVDAMCDAIGAAALRDREHLSRTVARIREERSRLTTALRELGFEVLPSQANFVLARRERPAAEWLYRELKNRGILVRFFNRPGLQDALRITVGLPEQTDALLAELRGLLTGSRTDSSSR